MDISLDPPGTLLVNNRYVRLSARVVYVIVILTVPITPDLHRNVFLAVAGAGLSLLMYWEWVVCLEKKSGLIEPKGLTVMMKRELGAKELATEYQSRRG
jgi:hypothetical protein